MYKIGIIIHWQKTAVAATLFSQQNLASCTNTQTGLIRTSVCARLQSNYVLAGPHDVF